MHLIETAYCLQLSLHFDAHYIIFIIIDLITITGKHAINFQWVIMKR